MTGGSALRALREERDLSRTELAYHLGVSKDLIGLYENGRRYPNLAMLRRMSKYFGIGLEQLADTLVPPEDIARTDAV